MKQVIKYLLSCTESCSPVVPPQIPLSVLGELFPTLHSRSLALENNWKSLTLCKPAMGYLPKLICTLLSCFNHQDSSCAVKAFEN